jgi:hypothetical protein
LRWLNSVSYSFFHNDCFLAVNANTSWLIMLVGKFSKTDDALQMKGR